MGCPEYYVRGVSKVFFSIKLGTAGKFIIFLLCIFILRKCNILSDKIDIFVEINRIILKSELNKSFYDCNDFLILLRAKGM